MSCSPIWGFAAKFGDHENVGSSEGVPKHATTKN